MNTIIIKNSYKYLQDNISSLLNDLSDDGSLFVICKNEYKDSVVAHDFLDVIQLGLKYNLNYINTIIAPIKTTDMDNIQYIVWLVKDRKKYVFDKNPIREKSIWKDVEWGKRAKNYNPLGKDPGNVWIPTEDDGQANITNHILLSPDKIYDRILKTTLFGNDSNYMIVTSDEKDLEYKYRGREGKVLFVKNNNLSDADFISKDKIDFSLKNKGDLSYLVEFDSSEKMSAIIDKNADLVITSPPYWDLKNYYKKGQIGYKEPYGEYSNRMLKVWKESYRTLRDSGSLWININIRTSNGKALLLPALFTKQCKELGFYYRGVAIWHKSSGIPSGPRNFSDHHEYILIFTKRKDMKIKDISCFTDYKNDNINGKLIWNINRKAGSVGKNTIHPAIFPTELVNRIIQCSTMPGDLVVDPFLGSGTSLIAAANNERSFIGYEFYEGFKSLMEDRFSTDISKKDISVSYNFSSKIDDYAN